MKPTPEQLAKVRVLWGLEASEISFIRRVENFVYAAELKGRPVILRLTEPTHRSKSQLESELNWMDHLTKQGMQLASPILSIEESFVETLDGQQTFFVSVFEKAAGAPLREPVEFTPQIMKTWGRYVGKMQRLTQSYRPVASLEARPQWNEDTSFQVVLKGLDEKNEIPFRRFHQQMEWLKTLPRSKDAYGLVHCDLHFGNFFVDQGRITAFDFDDSCYHWFVYDMITPLFHLWQKHDEGGLARPYQELEEDYLKGYLEENSLDSQWVDRKELFALFRINTVYHWAKANMAAGLFDENEAGRIWCEKLFTWAQERLQKEPEFF